MKAKFFLTTLLIIISNLLISSFAQGPSKEDYNRAVSFLWNNLTNKKVFNASVQPVWFSDSTGVGFVTQDKSGKYFTKVVFKEGKVTPWFDQEKLAQLLSGSLKTEVKANDLPVIPVSARSSKLTFRVKGKNYEISFPGYELKLQEEEKRNELESKSPDGKWIAYMKEYNLFIRSTSGETVKQLSHDGKRGYEFGTYYGWSDIIEGENGERPQRLSVNWSPDSRFIQTYITDLRNAEKMYLLDWSIDSLYKPRLLSYYRGSPGDTTMVKMIPVFYNVETGEEYVKQQLKSTHTNPIGYRWSKQSGIVYQENAIRGYQVVELHRCDIQQRSEELLYRETSPTNIDNYQSTLVEEWGKAVITSERDGWKQLWLLDLKDKSLKRITSGGYYVTQVLHTDRKNKSFLFLASGKEPGRNPYHQHLYRLDLSTGKEILLTPEDVNHDVSVSPDGKWYTDQQSTLNQPTLTVLKSLNTKTAQVELCRADITALESLPGFRLPEPFTAIARDNLTVIYGALWKPTTFDASRKYPVIDQSYTGPHTFMFPRNFSSAFSRSNQALAELGFIVLTVDGMGTANRSKEFHNVSYKNMGKNLEDHRLAILQLGRKYPWMDTTRVGIFGHSAGGYDAGHAVLEYPDFYKVAVASSADHDFRMEKDWWPEMYMGWPVDSTYHQVSNITMAVNLKGKLLITHGGIDENVNPSATFKLAEALIKANKEFDMLIFPSQRHGYTGIYNDYFTRKKWNYFVEHLQGGQPLWDFQMGPARQGSF